MQNIGMKKSLFGNPLFFFLFPFPLKKVTHLFTLSNNFLHFSLTKNSKLISPLYQINQFLFVSKKKSQTSFFTLSNNFLHFSLTKIQNSLHLYITSINSYYYFKKTKNKNALPNTPHTPFRQKRIVFYLIID
jgi:hypothetical protein